MITLIKEFKEGLKVFKCTCGHKFGVNKHNKNIKCIYCGLSKDVEVLE